MPEFDAETDASSTDLPRPLQPLRSHEEFDDVDAEDNEPGAREGLPPSYRMRADRHYIDRMSDSVGVPVRLIPIDRLDQSGPSDLPSAAPGDPLTQSIAAHGVLQPLLVAKRDGGYRVIAGRRRLAAAIAAGLKAVPCLLHDVDDAEATALAEADNLHNLQGGSPGASAGRSLPVDVAEIMQEMLSDLRRMDRSVALLRHSSGGSVYQKTAVDLIAAQTWRAGWLAGASAFLLGGHRQARKPRSLAAIVERVVGGFEPEMRLAGGQLRSSIAAGSAMGVDEVLGELALSSAVVSTLFVLQSVEQPVIDLRASASDDVVTLECVQQSTATSWEVERVFAEAAPAGKGQLVLGLAAALLRELASQYGGAVGVISDGRRDSGIRCTFRA